MSGTNPLENRRQSLWRKFGPGLASAKKGAHTFLEVTPKLREDNEEQEKEVSHFILLEQHQYSCGAVRVCLWIRCGEFTLNCLCWGFPSWVDDSASQQIPFKFCQAAPRGPQLQLALRRGREAMASKLAPISCHPPLHQSCIRVFYLIWVCNGHTFSLPNCCSNFPLTVKY